MKAIVIYYSKTGNTRKVAEAIAQELEAELKSVDEVVELGDYDLFCVGTPVYAGCASEKIKKFLDGLPAGRERHMYHVYAIFSKKDNRIYIGITKNIGLRIKEHNLEKTKSTKYYRPWKLFYSEVLENRLLARKREKELKSGAGKEFLKEKLICACSSAG